MKGWIGRGMAKLGGWAVGFRWATLQPKPLSTPVCYLRLSPDLRLWAFGSWQGFAVVRTAISPRPVNYSANFANCTSRVS